MKYLIGDDFLINYGDVATTNGSTAMMDLPSSEHTADVTLYKDVITAAAFLPRVQLFGGNSEACKTGLIIPGHYGIVRSKDQLEDLGVEFDFFPLSWRFKAMRIPGDGNVLTYHNPKLDEFKKIMVEAQGKDSGCMYGLEFLIWLNEPFSCFATFYLSSKTARRQAPILRDHTESKPKKFTTGKVEYIKKGKNSWHGPVIVPCSTPFALPSAEDALAEATRFANPQDSVVEKATSTTSRET